MSNKVCTCGKGYASIWDNKCSNCRTSKEQIAHQYALDQVREVNPETMEDAIKFYKELKRVYK